MSLKISTRTRRRAPSSSSGRPPSRRRVLWAVGCVARRAVRAVAFRRAVVLRLRGAVVVVAAGRGIRGRATRRRERREAPPDLPPKARGAPSPAAARPPPSPGAAKWPSRTEKTAWRARCGSGGTAAAASRRAAAARTVATGRGTRAAAVRAVATVPASPSGPGAPRSSSPPPSSPSQPSRIAARGGRPAGFARRRPPGRPPRAGTRRRPDAVPPRRGPRRPPSSTPPRRPSGRGSSAPQSASSTFVHASPAPSIWRRDARSRSRPRRTGAAWLSVAAVRGRPWPRTFSSSRDASIARPPSRDGPPSRAAARLRRPRRRSAGVVTGQRARDDEGAKGESET